MRTTCSLHRSNDLSRFAALVAAAQASLTTEDALAQAPSGESVNGAAKLQKKAPLARPRKQPIARPRPPRQSFPFLATPKGIKIANSLVKVASESQPAPVKHADILVAQYCRALRNPNQALEAVRGLRVLPDAKSEAVTKAIGEVIDNPVAGLRVREAAADEEEFKKMLCFLLDVQFMQQCYLADKTVPQSAEYGEHAFYR